MLVLSRKEQEKIVFPNLGITVEILRIAGSAVRVGVDAPRSVVIQRHELLKAGGAVPVPAVVEQAAPDLSHRLRNRLNAAGLALQLMQKQLQAGMFQEGETTLQIALHEFELLDQEIVPPVSRSSASNSRRALLVEDDSNECELLAGILRMSGYEVDTAADGFEALDCLARSRPDVVLLDMNMPRCDGLATLKAIRNDPTLRDLRVFAVSGRTQRELGIATGERGVDRWFQKPIDPRRLLSAIDAQFESACIAG